MMDELFLTERLTAVWILTAILTLGALVSILRSRHGTKARIVWMIVVLIFPIFGAIAWFALGREARKHRR